MKKGSSFRKVIECISDGMAVVSGVLLSLLVLTISLSVILRYYFHFSVGWVTEIEEYVLFLAVMLGTPWVLKHDKHVTVDAVVNSLAPEKRRKLAVFSNFLGALIGIVLLYYSGLTTYQNFVTGALLVKIMPIPKYMPLMFIPLSCIFFSLHFLFKVWDGLWPEAEDGEKAGSHAVDGN